MNMSSKPPKRLYKYKKFNPETLQMVIVDQIYFADPNTFNDPLDSKPALKIDVDRSTMEKILLILVEKRIANELSAAAEILQDNAPKTLEYISHQSRGRARKVIEDTKYYSSNPSHEVNDLEFYDNLLKYQVKQELINQKNKGIFSLGTRDNCPLMWSHYGDQHKGICLGYSLSEKSNFEVLEVKYDETKLIQASTVLAMLDGDKNARREIDDKIFLRKAGEWKYEKEWRAFGKLHLQDSDLELEEVIFGLRCGFTEKYTICKALEGRRKTIEFYEIKQKEIDKFHLQKNDLDMGQLFSELPRRKIPTHELKELFKN